MMMRLIVVMAPGTISAHGVSCMWSVWPTSRYVGMRPPLKNIVKTIKNMTGFFSSRFRRERAYAPSAVMRTFSDVPATT